MATTPVDSGGIQSTPSPTGPSTSSPGGRRARPCCARPPIPPPLPPSSFPPSRPLGTGFRGAAALAQRRRLRPVRPCLFYFFLEPRPETTDTGRQRAVLLAGVVETAAATGTTTGTVSASSDEPPPYPSRSRRALPSRALFPRAPGRSASEVKSTQGQLNFARRRRHSIGAATCSSLRRVRRRRTTLLWTPPVPRGDEICSCGVSCLAPTPAPRGAEGLSEASALLSLWACSVCEVACA